jgi:tRNA-dihydrouridine synthase A
LLDVDSELFGAPAPHASMHEAIEAFIPYIEDQLAQGVRLHAITRHMVGAFHGVPGARAFRRALAEKCNPVDAGVDALPQADSLVSTRELSTVAA